MFIINEDKSIYITRGDVAFFSIEAKTDTGEKYKFMPGDVVRFKVYGKKDCENVVLSKDFGIESEADEASIYLEEKDTKFGGVISKPTDFWYEVELNPYTDPQTILGYDEDGAKIFKLFPEGNEKEDENPVTPEDIPVVDEELDLTSTRPVQNQAIARAIAKISTDVTIRTDAIEESMETRMDSINDKVDANLHNVPEPQNDRDAVNLAFAKKNCVIRRCRLQFDALDNLGFYKPFSGDYPDYGDLAVLVAGTDRSLRCTVYADNEVLVTDKQTGDPCTDPVLFLDCLVVENLYGESQDPFHPFI